MLKSLLTWLYGCQHQRTTFPLTPRGETDRQSPTVTCLDCGRQFEYSWEAMRRGRPVGQPDKPIVPCPVEAARRAG
jgi:hypothetical protein